MLEGSHSIALIYRLYYKCMKTNLNIHALVKSPRDKTVLIQSNSEANLPTSWITENESYPQNLQNHTVNLDYIQQYLDGIVRISFDQQRVQPLRIKELSRTNSTTSIPRIDSSSQISKPCYSTQSRFDEDSTPQGSPTQSDFESTPQSNPLQPNPSKPHPSLQVLHKPFSINFEKLYKDYE
ncbi:hypothetical protein RHMOL_Rhmol05G0156500 [Rhododendron molle]|uniref:Uncharacterized protein n=1 Tax=Rhododendron molle TaxID=49168 RepID=A0ACC0NRT9_RHOML|nr:hypothetical protein RHMOL_Rhmol05G0156500 [Rhododendron molle]